MSDLISRSDAIEAIASHDTTDGNTVCFTGKMVIGYINALPSVQPTHPTPSNTLNVLAKTIRCKNCSWWTKQEKSLQGRCARFGIYPTGEWYCAGAEMRGDSNDN